MHTPDPYPRGLHTPCQSLLVVAVAGARTFGLIFVGIIGIVGIVVVGTIGLLVGLVAGVVAGILVRS